MNISKKELLQSQKGLMQLRGMLAEKRADLSKQAKQLKRIAQTQETPAWAEEVMKEFQRGINPGKPFRYYRVLNILHKHKIL